MQAGTLRMRAKRGVVEVSIPFKREGVLQVYYDHKRIGANRVSIPFKREGVLQVVIYTREGDFFLFQFPSNGKVYCKYKSK